VAVRVAKSGIKARPPVRRLLVFCLERRARMRGMATKERIHQLVDSLPDTPETEQRLDVIEDELEPNGASEPNGAVPPNGAADEGPIPTLEESIAILASVEFPPREDAWR